MEQTFSLSHLLTRKWLHGVIVLVILLGLIIVAVTRSGLLQTHAASANSVDLKYINDNYGSIVITYQTATQSAIGCTNMTSGAVDIGTYDIGTIKNQTFTITAYASSCSSTGATIATETYVVPLGQNGAIDYLYEGDQSLGDFGGGA